MLDEHSHEAIRIKYKLIPGSVHVPDNRVHELDLLCLLELMQRDGQLAGLVIGLSRQV